MKTLNRREIMFCKEYVIDWNAARAARAAGFSVNGAAQRGHDLLQRTDAQQYIAELCAGIHKRVEMRQERIIAEVENMFLADRRNLVDEDGKYKKLNEIDDETAACIDGYKVSDKGVEIKTVPKLAALRQLAEFKGMLVKKIEVTDHSKVVVTEEERNRLLSGLENEI